MSASRAQPILMLLTINHCEDGPSRGVFVLQIYVRLAVVIVVDVSAMFLYPAMIFLHFNVIPAFAFHHAIFKLAYLTAVDRLRVICRYAFMIECSDGFETWTFRPFISD